MDNSEKADRSSPSTDCNDSLADESNEKELNLSKKRCQCNYEGNKEARAWAFNSVGQGAAIITGVYIATAILGLAKQDAGCGELPPGAPCDARVYGAKPSSLLTIMTSVTSFISSFCMPFIGAIVDHTDYRRMVALVSAVLVVILNAVQICIGENTWFIMVILFTVTPVMLLIHNLAMMAYLHELSNVEKTLTRFVASFQVIRQTTMITMLVVVLALTSVWPGIAPRGTVEFDVTTARIAQVLISVACAISFFFTFYNGIGPRKALSKKPENTSLFSAGFRKLYRTIKHITSNPALSAIKWYLISCIFYGSMLGSALAVAITYMTFHLSFGATENAVATFIFLIGSIVGASVLPFGASKVGLLDYLKMCIFVWTVMWAIIGVSIEGPDQGNVFYGFAFFWGFLAGSIVPNGRLLYLSIIPKGQEAEMMGIFLFFINGFVWLPPLVLTAMNEAGISLRVSVSMCSIFTVLALIALHMMGELNEAKEKVRKASMANITDIEQLDPQDDET